MNLACVFPGQGSQKVAMCKELYDSSAIARAVFQEADEALKQNLSKIIFEGPGEELTLTANTQPALMACSIAILRVLEKELGKKLPEFCKYVAGHSLGEFTALTAANAISLSDCARILRIRGLAMQDAVPLGKGAMFALLGANIAIAQEIAKDASEFGACQVANDNSPEQQVLSGDVDAVDKAIELASTKGYKAIKLNVSAPFHSTLMIPAQEKLRAAMEEINISEPQIPVIANISTEILTIDKIKQNLVDQVISMVRWTESMRKLKQYHVATVLEVGPGRVYSNLLKRIDSEMIGVPINDMEGVRGFIETTTLI